MILADTSVWVHHLRYDDPTLRQLLERGEVACHPFIVGELACGTLRQRREILSLLAELPRCPVAEHHEVLALIESRRLMGRGLGWIDVHLVAAALVAGAQLWTRDRPLASAATACGVGVAF